MKKPKSKREKTKLPKKDKARETKNPPASPTLPTRNSVFSLYPLILILLVGILSYSNTLHGPFVFDDIRNIVAVEGLHLDNLSSGELIKLGQTILDKGRPVALASFALNYYFGKLNTFGYHLVNLLIHLLTAILVYLFLKLALNLPSLEKRYGKWAHEIALLSSLLFVTHPIQTQAVSYIVQRMASMATLFFILALYCYAKARLAEGKKQTAYFAGTALAALLAFGSKENTITLPFFIALYEYYFWQRVDVSASLKPKPSKGNATLVVSGFCNPDTQGVGKTISRRNGKRYAERSTKKKWLYTMIGLLLLASLLAGIYIKFDLSQLLAGYKIRTFTPGQRMLTQLRVVIFYIGLLIAPLPSRLNIDHHFPLSYSLLNPPTTLLCLFLVLGLIAGSIYLAKKRPLISFALIWFWANLVVESSFIPLELVYEHRLYLPSMGFFLLVGILLVKEVEKLKMQPQVKQGIKVGFLLALIIPLSIMTYQRNRVWQDGVTLWKDAVSKSPGKDRPHHNLGCALGERGQLTEAITQYQLALQLVPNRTETHKNLGIIYLWQDKSQQAVTEFLAEIKVNPNNASVYYNLGNAYRDQGQTTEAIAQYQRALKISPGVKVAHHNLGSIYYSQGKLAQAIAEFLAEIKLNPDNAGAYYSLGFLYAEQGQLGEAIAQYQCALERDPGFKDAHNNLGNIYRRQGKFEQAITEFLEEIKHHPDNDKAHKNLGIICLDTGNRAKAVPHFKKSLALAPQQPQASKMRQFIKEQQKHLSP